MYVSGQVFAIEWFLKLHFNLKVSQYYFKSQPEWALNSFLKDTNAFKKDANAVKTDINPIIYD